MKRAIFFAALALVFAGSVRVPTRPAVTLSPLAPGHHLGSVTNGPGSGRDWIIQQVDNEGEIETVTLKSNGDLLHEGKLIARDCRPVESMGAPVFGIASVQAGALDERAPVTVQVSPREAFALHLVLNALSFKGDDQDAHARVSEALGFAALDVRAKEIKRAEKGREATGDDFSEKLAAHTIPKDDIIRLLGWLKEASVPGVFNEVLNPLVRRLRKATGAP